MPHLSSFPVPSELKQCPESLLPSCNYTAFLSKAKPSMGFPPISSAWLYSSISPFFYLCTFPLSIGPLLSLYTQVISFRKKFLQLPCPTLSPRVCSNSYPLSWWCHPTISSSVVPFSSCPQSFPLSESFPISQLFTSSDQSTGASASVSILSIRFRVLFPLGLTGLISLLSKGLSRVFSSTTVQNHQFVGAQPSSWSNSHIHSWLLDKP